MIRSIIEVRELFSLETTLYTTIKTLLEKSISEKKVSHLKAGHENEIAQLQAASLVGHESETHFQVNFDNLVSGYVMLQVAQEILTEQLPTEIIPALSFVSRFMEEIRKPNIRTHWEAGWPNEFEGFVLVYLHQEAGLDITAFVLGVTEEMRDEHVEVRSVDFGYLHAFAYLSDSVEKCFQAIQTLYGSDRTRDTAFSCVENLCKISPSKASELYEYAKVNNGADIRLLLSGLLTGLYKNDPAVYFAEAIALYDTHPAESLQALSWMPYEESKLIQEAFQFVSSKVIEDIEVIRKLPVFYTRLIDNHHTDQGTKKGSFAKINDLTSVQDTETRGSLLWRTGMLKGNDEEKMELLPQFLEWGDRQVLNDYFQYFDSPKHLFGLIRDSFMMHGMRVAMGQFEHALYSQYHRHKEVFNQELVQLLTDHKALVRYAGVQIMLSHHGGIYQPDFLSLDETMQLRVIDTLLPMPLNIEEFLPLLLTLRKSVYESVKQKLGNDLTDLLEAYGKHLIDMVKKIVGEVDDEDNALIKRLEAAYLVINAETDAKAAIKELNPWLNETIYIEQYYRLEQEKNIEMTEAAQSQSIFAQIARNITVIRGSGFRSDEGRDVSEMGKIEVSRLVDMRYYINPDAYEWNFKLNALYKNYQPNA